MKPSDNLIQELQHVQGNLLSGCAVSNSLMYALITEAIWALKRAGYTPPTGVNGPIVACGDFKCSEQYPHPTPMVFHEYIPNELPD